MSYDHAHDLDDLDRIDMRIMINRRLRDATAFHPNVEVAIEETVDALLELRDNGLALTAPQVDAVIRDHVDYDPATADVDEWAEVA